MLIGVCASMTDPEKDPAGIECIEPLKDLGFDYIELSLCHLAALPPEEFSPVVARLQRAGLPCRACNNFFPPTVRLTGPEADLGKSVTYAQGALRCAHQLGAKVVVFGSSGAKNVPAGFPVTQARPQIVELLKELGPLAQALDLTIVIEPISRPESNVILTAEDGFRLMGEVNHPHVRLLVDYYHLRTEQESDAILLSAGSDLRHLHIATPESRRFPMTSDVNFDSFVQKLTAIGYAGGISIEAFSDSFLDDARQSLKFLRSALPAAHV